MLYMYTVTQVQAQDRASWTTLGRCSALAALTTTTRSVARTKHTYKHSGAHNILLFLPVASIQLHLMIIMVGFPHTQGALAGTAALLNYYADYFSLLLLSVLLLCYHCADH
jgi:hypothetical protein